jgi:hypothetical protein
VYDYILVISIILYNTTEWSHLKDNSRKVYLGIRHSRRFWWVIWRNVLGNRVLRRVFGTKTEEVTGEWRKLHNKELNDLYSLPNIVRVVKSRRMRWAGHVARMGEDWVVHGVLVGKPEEKRPLGRPRQRWEKKIKMDLQEAGGRVVRTGRSWLRIGTGGGHLWVRWGTFGFHKCGEFLD